MQGGVCKPLGELGDLTFNEVAVRLQQLNWEFIVDSTKVSVNVLPAAANLIGYSLLLKGYMRYVHNRPYDNNLTEIQKKMQNKIRNRLLAGFVFAGAPVMLMALKTVAISTKDMFSIEVNSASTANAEEENISILGFIGLFLNRLPLLKHHRAWIKIMFILFFMSILGLKLLGFSLFADFFLNMQNLKLLSNILCVLAIFYLLLNLYLIHKFANKNVNIPTILPEFFIKWLSEFQIIVKTPEGIKEFKNMYYREIVIYSFIIICINLLF